MECGWLNCHLFVCSFHRRWLYGLSCGISDGLDTCFHQQDMHSWNHETLILHINRLASLKMRNHVKRDITWTKNIQPSRIRWRHVSEVTIQPQITITMNHHRPEKKKEKKLPSWTQLTKLTAGGNMNNQMVVVYSYYEVLEWLVMKKIFPENVI